MILHYFKLAKRGLLKNKYYTFLNVFGLVFGMLSALVIAKYIGGSLQFDRYHVKKDRIYSITQEEFINGNPQKSSNATYWGVGELVNQYPEVIDITRYNYHIGSLIIAEGDSGNRVSFFENRIFSVDSGFLKIFTFPLRYGNLETALSGGKSIVITSSASQRYFGNLNPVGKTLTVRVPWGKETTYEVTGVVEDVPKQSQFKFDFLLSHTGSDPNEFWFVPDCSTFVLVKENANTSDLSRKLTATVNEVPQLKSTNRKVTISLHSIAEIQLSNSEYLLIAVGLFIVFISWVNYINQVIAQSYWRMKEIGVLRVMGATQLNLKKQFVVESSLICLTSLILIILVYLGMEPSLQSLTDGHLLPLVGDPTLINFIFLSMFVAGVILAAAIPALILFSPDFGKTLQNAYSSKIGGIALRQVLVIVQFSISTILMISVFVISNQLDYMERKDKGIDLEDVLIVQAPIIKDTTWNVKRKTVEVFKQKCAEQPFVVAVASSTSVPSEEYRQETYLSLQGNPAKSMVHQNGVDEQFFDLYAVQFLAGRNFIPDANWKNKCSIILNESAARALGIVDFDKMINAKIVDHESDEVYELVGIVKDYHQTSLKFKVRPIAFKFNVVRGHFSLKMKGKGSGEFKLDEKLSAIKQVWAQTYPDASFEYFFLDEKFAGQDREEHSFGELFNYFTILSIIISCLGLFGLSLLISTKRQREIGVRKVFGASARDILMIFLRGYAGPLSAAVLIGSPVAYLLMNMWLRNFAYRIEVEFGLVSFSWLCLTLIFILTVSYHTIKSAFSNPVSILRD
jgi:putative ABC transport system permease protein